MKVLGRNMAYLLKNCTEKRKGMKTKSVVSIYCS